MGATKSLSVLFDAYWLVDGPPSGRNVLASLISAWIEAFPDDRITLAVPRKGAVIGSLVDLARVELIEVHKPRGMVHGLWVALRLGYHALGYDVLITQNFTPLAMSRKNRVIYATFVHDVLFAEYPEWFTWRERQYLRIATASARRSDVLLTSSLSEGRRISRAWRNQAPKVRSVGLASPLPLQRATSTRPKSSTLPSEVRPFILAVGRLNVRKNLARLVEAYSASTRLKSKFDLVIVGTTDGRWSGLSSKAVPATVRLLGAVSDGELVWLYQNCRLFVFPSLDEGFGLPLVEAKSCGSAVAASNIDVFRELGCVDYYFDPRSVSDIGRVLETALNEETAPGRGQIATSLPAWDDVAERTRAAILEVRT